MMWELIDLTTSHASSQEAVWANFGKDKGKARAEPTDEVKDHAQWGNGNNDSWTRCDSDFVTAVDRVH